MGIVEVIAVVAVVAAVASTAATVVQAEQQKAAAKKKAKLDQQRLELEQQQRELSRKNELARLKRAARAQQAQLLNRAAAGNVRFTTPTSAAFNAVRQNLAREFEFSSQTANLAKQGDAITTEQISLEKDAALARANAQIFIGVAEGVSSLAGAGASAYKYNAFNIRGNKSVADIAAGVSNQFKNIPQGPA